MHQHHHCQVQHVSHHPCKRPCACVRARACVRAVVRAYGCLVDVAIGVQTHTEDEGTASHVATHLHSSLSASVCVMPFRTATTAAVAAAAAAAAARSWHRYRCVLQAQVLSNPSLPPPPIMSP